MQIKRTTATVDNVNLRKEHHGDDLVKAFDISLRLTTGAKVLDDFVPVAKGEPLMRSVLFDVDGYPLYTDLFPLQVHDKVDGCIVSLFEPGKNAAMKFTECNLAGVKITPIHKNKVQLELKVQGTPTSDVGERLWGAIKCDCDVEITKQQQELKL